MRKPDGRAADYGSDAETLLRPPGRELRAVLDAADGLDEADRLRLWTRLSESLATKPTAKPSATVCSPSASRSSTPWRPSTSVARCRNRPSSDGARVQRG